MSSTVSDAKTKVPAVPGTPIEGPSPWKNPSYPARTHWSERAALETALRSWDQKIDVVANSLCSPGIPGGRSTQERLYHQMVGARDQMADAVHRMPRETGVLHEEDHERLVNAESALVRLFDRWDSLSK